MNEGLERLGFAYAKEVLSSNISDDDVGVTAGAVKITAWRRASGSTAHLDIALTNGSDNINISYGDTDRVLAVIRGIVAADLELPIGDRTAALLKERTSLFKDRDELVGLLHRAQVILGDVEQPGTQTVSFLDDTEAKLASLT